MPLSAMQYFAAYRWHVAEDAYLQAADTDYRRLSRTIIALFLPRMTLPPPIHAIFLTFESRWRADYMMTSRARRRFGDEYDRC